MTPMPESSDLYKILQVDPEASPEVIQAAHRLLSEIHHPDRNPAADAGARLDASARLAEINRAYEVLSDPQRRDAYDRHRASGALPDVIQAKSFRLVNDDWQTRAELSLDQAGDPMLVMNDRSGNRRFRIYQGENGQQRLEIGDQNGDARLCIGEDDNGTPMLYTTDSNGKRRFELLQVADGQQSIILNDQNGIIRLMLTGGGGGGVMLLTTSSNGEHGFAIYQVKGDHHHLPAPDDQNSDARSYVFR